MDTATETAESFETFEDLSTAVVEGSEDSVSEDDWSSGDGPEEKSVKKDEVKDDLKVLKDSKLDSDGKPIEEDVDGEESDKEKKEDKKEETKKEEEDEEELEESNKEEKAEEKKKDSKKLRLRMGEELFNVEADASLKVKVDGELQDVSIQELLNNYSGKTAWDKKFTEIGREKKLLESEKSKLQEQQVTLKDHIAKALAPLKDKDANPLDSLMYLVEISGEDPYTAYRRIMEANLEELGTLMDMTETERELHFHKKKDELHTSITRKRQEAYQKEQTFNQAVQKVDQLRQTYKVSEEEFVDASEELEEIYKNSGLDLSVITEEHIVDYASLRPHISEVKKLIEPYEDNISDAKYGEVVSSLAKNLRDGKADKATIQEILKRNFSVEEDVKDLNTKVYQKQGSKPQSKVSKESKAGSFETFDDWDE